VGDPDADLVVPGVGRLVAEEDQVVLGAGGPLGLDRLEDRVCRRPAVELGVGLEQDGPLDAERAAAPRPLAAPA
jgi:hypothetical protein